jgi:hypothetical protein
VLTVDKGEVLKMSQDALFDRWALAASAPNGQGLVNRLEMTKAYHRFRVRIGGTSGFALGLADFACLGMRRFDVAGYPYDDEYEAIYSDWVTLGQDIKTAEKTVDETSKLPPNPAAR